MTEMPEYTVDQEDDGTWWVFDPSGHQIAWYGPELDGDLAVVLARAHAAEKDFELRFMADLLKVSRKEYAEALAACQAEVDARVALGAL